MLNLTFRPCQAEDVEDALPLIYSSGPDAFNYAFCDSYAEQSLDFLRTAFVRGPSEFGYQQHTAAVLEGKVVGVGGVRFARQNIRFTFSAAYELFRFYSPLAALRTTSRGLRIEQILKPPKKGIGIIYNLGVAPEWHSHGIGQQLINKLLEQIAAAQMSVAALDVAVTNPRAQALYERLGFVTQETRKSSLRSKFGHVVAHNYMERPIK